MSYHWESHLEDIHKSRLAVPNQGACDCMLFAVGDVLRDMHRGGEWTVPALRALAVKIMRDPGRTRVWEGEWSRGGSMTWDRLIATANPACA